MKLFKSNIPLSLVGFFLITISVLIVTFLIFDFNLPQLPFWDWVLIVPVYITSAYLYAGATNNDILVFDGHIEIVNRLPLFKKHYTFQSNAIKSVMFKSEWTETIGGKQLQNIFIYKLMMQFISPFIFPADYKWIKISTDKDYKFYCFGLQFDYFDNPKPYFEDLFCELADRNIDVAWTDTSDRYYDQMMEEIKMRKENKEIQ